MTDKAHQLWVIAQAEQPAQVYFSVVDQQGNWLPHREYVPQDLQDEIADELRCDDHRAVGDTVRSRNYEHGPDAAGTP